MKKILITVIALFVVFTAGQSFACHITFAPEKLATAKVGETITIEAIITQEHRRCVLEDDEVSIELSENAKILKETGWERVDSRTLHNTLEIQIQQAGETSLRVFRECSKKGISEGTFEFNVQ